MPLPAEAAPSFLFIAELPATGGALVLSREDAHYVSRVCRARAGDLVSATDGRGTIARLRLTAIGARAAAEVEAVESCARARRAWVCCGAPEEGRADWLVEKLAELGVERFQPIDCERGAWRASASRRARWERLAVAALRQSRQPWLMEVRDPVSLKTVMGEVPGEAVRWVADPEGQSPATGDARGLTIGVVGPAAGFSPAERKNLAASGYLPVRLAASRLRSETAAMAWAAWWAGRSTAAPARAPKPA